MTLQPNNFHLPYNPKLTPIAKQMRQNPTAAERKLWTFLRNFPRRVLRQRPIDHFIVDFYCSSLRLVIEVDGESHYTEPGKESDEERTQILQGYGLTVIRFTNEQVLTNFEGVCTQLLNFVPKFPPLLRGAGGDLTSNNEGGNVQ
ncbi:endonuclease domain-containing protein [Roseofilum sp. BLCC_M154]|uniref:Endonuclease domain-containing protein n=1 Tax=Roseofilum acuticapitatum BLCC-M154 TaxID=3022444 RepID=A0ABT7AS99_9CYAN|nr:endonuclease domain-containing protein [Roseofilum acuticapitatum]MDJ1169787.1 endonuclease domain-containing protein [Roseofilum acuticapitatum BLCC-M154]